MEGTTERAERDGAVGVDVEFMSDWTVAYYSTFGPSCREHRRISIGHIKFSYIHEFVTQVPADGETGV